METALTSLIYFMSNLQILSMLIIILLVRFVMHVSYPIMLLLRLKIICVIHPIIMCISILQGIMWMVLKYFWVNWILTGNNHYFKINYIVQPITTVSLAIQNMIINVFFIILAKRKFENIVHLRYVIILECVVVTTEFLFISTWNLVSIVAQIKIRMEISVLVYIIEPHHEIVSELSNF